MLTGKNVNRRLILAALVTALALCGCSGGSGATGATGPSGPPGPVTGGVVTALVLTATGASLGATSSVNFKIVDQNGLGYVGLPLSTLEVTLAKLIPGVNGDDNAWQSYINVTAPLTAGLGSGTQATVEATTDTGGALVDHKDGTYTYTFGTNISAVTQPIAVPFDQTLTHRIGISVRSSTLPQANNGIYTWQPSSGNTTGILTQDMVDSTSCNSCHDHLSAHGGPRQDPRLCVTCHNPGSVEPNSGNTLDFKVMFHKIHDGKNLPSVVAGTPYVIYGYGSSKNDFSGVVFPQSVENCTKCHNPADTNTPDAGRYATAPSMQACGACHDNVNFAQGVAGGHPGGVVTDNTQCSICHSANGVAGSVDQSHAIVGKVDAANFKYNIISVTKSGPGQTPSIQFSVTNPNNNNSFYNLATDPAWTASGGNSRLEIDMAWSTTDYQNIGSATYPGQPVSFNALTATSNGDGTYTAMSPTAIPAGTTGSGAVAIEGHPADTTVTPVVKIPVTSAVQYFAITDAQPVARRTIVATTNCENCHGQNDGLSLHGANRTDNVQLCVMCHNPDATDLSQRPTDPDGTVNGVNTAAVDGLEQRQIDFKYEIHAIHSAAFRTGDFVIYQNGGTPNNFSTVLYPGILNDCSQCHTGTTYEPPLAATDLGTTTNTNATVVPNACPASPGATNYAPCAAVENTVLYGRISPTASVCSACHSDPTSMAHMGQNGGSVTPYPGVTEATIGSSTVTTETCAVCHGAGAVEDVAVVHAVQ